MRSITFLLGVLILSGCAYVTAQEELGPFVGKPVQMAVAQYGAPASIQAAQDSQSYVWQIERHHSGSFPGLTSTCQVTMLVNAQGIVTAYSIRKVGGAEMLDSCR